jgi:hypothetical protein
MPQDKWLVIYDTQVGSAGESIPFSQTSAAGHTVKGGFEPALDAAVTLIEAESAQEAVTGVRKAFGDGVVTNKMRVIKNSNVEELTA